MSHLVTRIFDGFSDRSSRSTNGLAIFCACVCVFTCCFSILTTSRRDAGPSKEFFDLAADLKVRLKTMDEKESELVTASHQLPE